MSSDDEDDGGDSVKSSRFIFISFLHYLVRSAPVSHSLQNFCPMIDQ